MNFDEIVTEALTIRFREAQRASIKEWTRQAYQQIWGMADWPWKRIGPVDISVVAGSSNPTLPDGFLRPYHIYDNYGATLAPYNPDEFDRLFMASIIENDQGIPNSYKWVDSVITLGPIPSSDATFKLVYETKPRYLANGTTPTVGQMTQDTDTPIWDAAYHYVLVHGAVAIGLRTQNDPTYIMFDEIFQNQITSMQDHYLPVHSTISHLQFGNEWDAH